MANSILKHYYSSLSKIPTVGAFNEAAGAGNVNCDTRSVLALGDKINEAFKVNTNKGYGLKGI